MPRIVMHATYPEDRFFVFRAGCRQDIDDSANAL